MNGEKAKIVPAAAAAQESRVRYRARRNMPKPVLRKANRNSAAHASNPGGGATGPTGRSAPRQAGMRSHHKDEG